MRPFPWIIRVSLFALGLGVGLSHYKAPSTERPVVLELHFPMQEVESRRPPFTPGGCIPPAKQFHAVYSTRW